MKLLFTIGLSVCCLSAFSQNKSDGVSLGWSSPLHLQNNGYRAEFDTLYTPNIYGLAWGTPLTGCDEIAMYNAGSGGYISGNNGDGDLEKMQKFYTSGMLGVFETLVLFTHKSVAHPNAMIACNIYSLNTTTHGPDTIIYTSDSVALADVFVDEISPNYTGFPFPVTIPVSDSFFVSFTLPQQAGDTVVAATSTDGCYPGHQVAWERESDGTFRAFNDGTPDSWGLDVEIFIAPVVELSLSNGEVVPVYYNGLTLLKAYPIPSDDKLYVEYELADASDVVLQLTDLTGRIVMQKPLGMQAQGFHQGVFETGELPSGAYNFGIKFGNKALFSRFVKE